MSHVIENHQEWKKRTTECLVWRFQWEGLHYSPKSITKDRRRPMAWIILSHLSSAKRRYEKDDKLTPNAFIFLKVKKAVPTSLSQLPACYFPQVISRGRLSLPKPHQRRITSPHVTNHVHLAAPNWLWSTLEALKKNKKKKEEKQE